MNTDNIKATLTAATPAAAMVSLSQVNEVARSSARSSALPSCSGAGGARRISRSDFDGHR